MKLEEFYSMLTKNVHFDIRWRMYQAIGDGIAHAAIAIVACEHNWKHERRSCFINNAKSNKTMSNFVKSKGLDGIDFPPCASRWGVKTNINSTKKRADLFEAWIGFLHEQFGYQYALLAAKELAYFAVSRNIGRR